MKNPLSEKNKTLTKHLLKLLQIVNFERVYLNKCRNFLKLIMSSRNKEKNDFFFSETIQENFHISVSILGSLNYPFRKQSIFK